MLDMWTTTELCLFLLLSASMGTGTTEEETLNMADADAGKSGVYS